MTRAAVVLLLGSLLVIGCGGGPPVSLEDGGTSPLEGACVEDTDCAFGEACVEGFCGMPVSDPDSGRPECTSNAECAEGYECIPSLGACRPIEKIAPDAGEFDAGPPPECVEGERVNCGSSKLGECRLGISTCVRQPDGSLAFGPCEGAIEPLPEACDGQDNDCDGIADDGLPEATCGVGACERTVSTCEGGSDVTCLPGAPGEESCNGVDDDCDGAVDEDIASIQCGVGVCSRTVAACNASAPNTCTPGAPSPEQCNGLDDDCDGVADDDIGQTSCGKGVCRRTVDICKDGALQACTPGPSSAETCNGLDDDCDGFVDEDLGVVTCGVGACGRMVAACENGLQGTCSPGTPTTEVCNGADDNCDGQIDEDLGTTSCGDGLCQNTVAACTNGAPTQCTPLPGSAESCDGVDNDCDGMIDEGCDCIDGQTRGCYTGPAGTQGVGICQGGSQTCAGGQWGTCSGQTLPASESCNGADDDCDGSVDESLGSNTCGVGECARTEPKCVNGALNTCTPGSPSTETCNGLDDDCDGAEDDGLGTQTCGVGACERTVSACFEGQDNVCTPGTSSTEVCNGVDDDCDGTTDEGLGTRTCGQGVCVNTVDACTNGTETQCTPLPNATAETCNGLDDDCDGRVDDDGACNQPPVVTCPGPMTVNANTTVTLSTSATDPNGDALSCAWSVVSRPSTSSGTFTNQSCGSAKYFADVAGTHQVRFTATDPYGASASCVTDITVLPTGDLWVELTWDRKADFDLHLRHPSHSGNIGTANGWNSSPYDCHWKNKTPSWDATGTADDPSLDRDDYTGTGPENIRINVPSTSHSYAVGVHLFSATAGSAITATVKVYCSGQLAATKTRSFNKIEDLWIVGAVQFAANGTCTFTDDGRVVTLKSQL